MEIITKEKLIEKLHSLKSLGWIKSARPGNAGGVGNTLEDYLGIKENNLPLPNATEWELKCQRLETSSLITMFHMEPSPRALKFVPSILLPKYGWQHQEAGGKYPSSEMSFRQTISGKRRSDRGFMIIIDRIEEKVVVSFDALSVDKTHLDWLDTLHRVVGLEELNPQPYWGFTDLLHKAGTKIHNTFYIQAETKKENGEEFFNYSKALILTDFSFDNFISAIENGFLFVDFDARTGHNHGTKFRLKQNQFPLLYSSITEI